MQEALGQRSSAYCRDTVWNISLAQIVLWLSVAISVCKSFPPPKKPSSPAHPSAFSITADTAFNIRRGFVLEVDPFKDTQPPPNTHTHKRA